MHHACTTLISTTYLSASTFLSIYLPCCSYSGGRRRRLCGGGLLFCVMGGRGRAEEGEEVRREGPVVVVASALTYISSYFLLSLSTLYSAENDCVCG